MLLAFFHFYSFKSIQVFRPYIMRDNVITPMANEMSACIFLCFKFFGLLISNVVNINNYNTHK